MTCFLGWYNTSLAVQLLQTRLWIVNIHSLVCNNYTERLDVEKVNSVNLKSIQTLCYKKLAHFPNSEDIESTWSVLKSAVYKSAKETFLL